MSTVRAHSSSRPDRVAASRDRRGDGAIQTRRPPGRRAEAALATKRSSMSAKPGPRDALRPMGGFVITRVRSAGLKTAESARSRVASTPAARRFLRAAESARASTSVPSSHRSGRGVLSRPARPPSRRKGPRRHRPHELPRPEPARRPGGMRCRGHDLAAPREARIVERPRRDRDL